MTSPNNTKSNGYTMFAQKIISLSVEPVIESHPGEHYQLTSDSWNQIS